jgi:predicted alpha/beta superfamily hydrolase
MQPASLQTETLRSDFVGSRKVTIWLPPGYADDAAARHPVVYMHDGNVLFEPESNIMGWNLGPTLSRLCETTEITPPLLVGIWRTDRRFTEYSPQKAFESHLPPEILADVRRTGFYPHSDGYLSFIVNELKPFIDESYRSRPDARNTFLVGSSLGGIMSIYGLCEYPELFGGAGCLSSHWPIGAGVMVPYLRDRLPAAGRHKLYFDHGTETIEAQYVDFQKQVDSLVRERGYTADRDWMTRVFAGHDHTEGDWRARVHLPLKFFLKDL